LGLITAKVFGFFFSFLTLSYKPAGHPVPHLHAGIFSFFWRNLRTSWLLLAEPFVNRQSMNQDQIQMVVYFTELVGWLVRC